MSTQRHTHTGTFADRQCLQPCTFTHALIHSHLNHRQTHRLMKNSHTDKNTHVHGPHTLTHSQWCRRGQRGMHYSAYLRTTHTKLRLPNISLWHSASPTEPIKTMSLRTPPAEIGFSTLQGSSDNTDTSAVFHRATIAHSLLYDNFREICIFLCVLVCVSVCSPTNKSYKGPIRVLYNCLFRLLNECSAVVLFFHSKKNLSSGKGP